MMKTASLTMLALVFSAGSAVAQVQQPAQAPLPPGPAVIATPPLMQPAKAPPPPRPVNAATAAATTPLIAEPLRPAPRAGMPLDSLRVAPAAVVQPARVVAPPARSTPPRPGTTTQISAPASLRASAAAAPPPSGSTMRCKDGTWLPGAPDAHRCDANGGLAVVLPAAKGTPPPPARRP